MKTYLLPFLLCLISLSVFSQDEETLFGRSGLSLTGAWGGPVTNFTKFNDDYTVFSGGYGGLEFNRSFFIGWGGFSVDTDKELAFLNNQRLDMKYNGLMLGYAFKPHKVVHPQLMLLTGSGKVKLNGEREDRVFVLQPSLGVEFNILRWFHIVVDGGYRFATDIELANVSDSDLSAPFGEIKFKFGWSWGW